MCSIYKLIGYFLSIFIMCCRLFTLYSKKVRDYVLKSPENKCFSSIKIFLITTENECKLACNQLKSACKDFSALGFDCEWVYRDKKQRPVALLQLATVHGFCCLFRLNILKKIPCDLQQILSDSNIIKLGVSPLHDAQLLMKDYNTKVISTLDLRHLYSTNTGLASLADNELGVTLNKKGKVRRSNWEHQELTYAQKDYAAKDAFISVELFKNWLVKNSKSQTSLNHLLNDEKKSEISVYLDINFKPKNLPENLNDKNSLENNVNDHSQKLNNISSQDKKNLKGNFVTRKTPLYHNCFMHAPNGELLCSCDRRKAQWYLDRGLAEVLPGEPYSIALLFEPAGRSGKSDEGRFYQQLKQNCCVVCGENKSYLKHYVVPKEYRKHFPRIMKNHQSHDIVLMCLRCHNIVTSHDDKLKEELARLCNAPTKKTKVETHWEGLKVKNSAKALLNSGDVIPNERKRLLEEKIKKYFKVDSLDLTLLEEAAKLKPEIVKDQSHGIKVVNYFIQEGGGLEKFEILWREHFLKTMKPQYLPALWSVTHNHLKLNLETNRE